jgi:mannose-6-phosphate isomerase-like protein (cupin superfamily)
VAHEGQTVVNSQTGQRQTFTRLTADLLEMESTHPPRGRPEPRHAHPRQESWVGVHRGELVFELGGERVTVGPGEEITIPAGAVHTFWNEGSEEAASTGTFRPALDIASFFETYAALAQRGELNPSGMPGLLQLAVMIPAYGEEIRPTMPPWPVQRALAAILGPIARRGGRSSASLSRCLSPGPGTNG